MIASSSVIVIVACWRCDFDVGDHLDGTRAVGCEAFELAPSSVGDVRDAQHAHLLTMT